MNHNNKQEQDKQQPRRGAPLRLLRRRVHDRPRHSEAVPQHPTAEHHQVQGDDHDHWKQEEAESEARFLPLEPFLVLPVRRKIHHHHQQPEEHHQRQRRRRYGV